jgi:hypothetical protein
LNQAPRPDKTSLIVGSMVCFVGWFEGGGINFFLKQEKKYYQDDVSDMWLLQTHSRSTTIAIALLLLLVAIT